MATISLGQVARGYNCVLAVNDAVVGEAREVDYTMTAATQDITSRLNAGWETSQPGKRVLKCTTKTLGIPGNAYFQTLLGTYYNQGYFTFQMTDENGYGVSGTGMLDLLKPGPQDQDNAVMCEAEFHSVGLVYAVAGGTTGAP